MHSLYMESCIHFSSAFFDWNEAFQQAWECEDTTIPLAVARHHAVQKIVRAFAHVISRELPAILDNHHSCGNSSGTRDIVTLGTSACATNSGAGTGDVTTTNDSSNLDYYRRRSNGDADAAIRCDRGAVHLARPKMTWITIKSYRCYRSENIFLHVLLDSRIGRNYMASLRGVLQRGRPALTVPLTVMVHHAGIAAMAHALVPLKPSPMSLLGPKDNTTRPPFHFAEAPQRAHPPTTPRHDGDAVAQDAAAARCTGESVCEVRSAVCWMAHSMRRAAPCAVYAGGDGRWYVLRTNLTTTSMVPRRNGMALHCTPVQREESVPWMCGARAHPHPHPHPPRGTRETTTHAASDTNASSRQRARQDHRAHTDEQAQQQRLVSLSSVDTMRCAGLGATLLQCVARHHRESAAMVRQDALCDHLHRCGVNLCLLYDVFQLCRGDLAVCDATRSDRDSGGQGACGDGTRRARGGRRDGGDATHSRNDRHRCPLEGVETRTKAESVGVDRPRDRSSMPNNRATSDRGAGARLIHTPRGTLLCMIALEMVCRTIKELLELEMQKRLRGCCAVEAERCLSWYLWMSHDLAHRGGPLLSALGRKYHAPPFDVTKHDVEDGGCRKVRSKTYTNSNHDDSGGAKDAGETGAQDHEGVSTADAAQHRAPRRNTTPFVSDCTAGASYTNGSDALRHVLFVVSGRYKQQIVCRTFALVGVRVRGMCPSGHHHQTLHRTPKRGEQARHRHGKDVKPVLAGPVSPPPSPAAHGMPTLGRPIPPPSLSADTQSEPSPYTHAPARARAGTGITREGAATRAESFSTSGEEHCRNTAGAKHGECRAGLACAPMRVVSMTWITRPGRSIVPRCADPFFALAMHACYRDVHLPEMFYHTYYRPLCIQVCRWRGDLCAAVQLARRALAHWVRAAKRSKSNARGGAGHGSGCAAWGCFYTRCVLCELLVSCASRPSWQADGGRMIGVELFELHRSCVHEPHGLSTSSTRSNTATKYTASADTHRSESASVTSPTTARPSNSPESMSTSTSTSPSSSSLHLTAPIDELLHEPKGDMVPGDDCVSRITRARCFIRLGSVLLGSAKDNRASFVCAALKQFRTARTLLSELWRAGWCARLYLTAALGILRCAQHYEQAAKEMRALPRALLLQSLVADVAVLVQGRAGPGELLVCYLWELGVELFHSGVVTDAIRVLTKGVILLRTLSVSGLDERAMTADLLDVYRAYDPERYSVHCDAVMTL